MRLYRDYYILSTYLYLMIFSLNYALKIHICDSFLDHCNLDDDVRRSMFEIEVGRENVHKNKFTKCIRNVKNLADFVFIFLK